jgi:glycerophosphoryl diester phosphodiesterase
MRNKNQIINVAHRGYSGKYLENSLEAIEKSLGIAQMIEFDVHLTKDEELVVTHDFELGRTIALKGNVDDYTLNDLKKMNTPSLADVLALTRDKIHLNVELKEETVERRAVKINIMVTKTLNLLKEFGFNHEQNNFCISSFNEDVLQKIAQLDSKIKLGVLHHYPEKGLKLEFAKKINAFSYNPNHKKLTAKDVEVLNKAGLKVYPYTANTIAEFKKLHEFKVDAIITNEIELLRDYLK